MKKGLASLFGLGDPRGYLTGLTLFLIGTLIITDGQIGIQATPESEVRWITVFAELDDWMGWLLIWMGFDSLFNFKLTSLLIEKVLLPVVKPVTTSIIGEERIQKFQERLKTKKGDTGKESLT